MIQSVLAQTSAKQATILLTASESASGSSAYEKQRMRTDSNPIRSVSFVRNCRFDS